MRTENIDMIFAPKAKPSPAALRPGGDASRGGAPAEGREARERFELPEEARQTRQDQAATRRADARSDDMRRVEMRMDAARRDEAGSLAHERRDARGPDDATPSRSPAMPKNEGHDPVGRDEALDRQKMLDAHEKRGVGASAEAGAGASAESDLETDNPEAGTPEATASELPTQMPVSDLSEAGLEGLDTAEKSGGGTEATPLAIIAEGATAVPVTPSSPAAEGVAAIEAAVEQNNPAPPQQAAVAAVAAGGDTGPVGAAEAAVLDTPAAAPVASLVVKPEPGSSEAGGLRRGDASATGVPASGAQITAAQSVNGATTATAPTFSEIVLDAAEAAPASPEPESGDGGGNAAPAMDDESLRRALGQLGIAAPGQGTPPASGQGQAQAVVAEFAQPNSASSTQGLAQALSSLAEAAGKAAANPATPAVPTAPVVPNVPLGAVPIEIGLKALAGVNHFQIRLDPAELGRIDVNLRIETDGTITARLTVDRVETLSLLQRDARMLERAFEQAGFKPSEGGLDLSLRDQGGRDDRRGEADRGYRQSPEAHGRWAGDGEAKQVEPIIVQRTIWRGAAGIDVRI